MSVTFTPGPHPTTRSSSTISIPPSSNTSTPRGSSFRVDPNNTPADSPSTSHHHFHSQNSISEDPEAQPLLPTGQLNRPKIFYPIVFGILGVVALGIVIFVGGMHLGRGAGGERWPGGPGML
ncbi:hypothetical protein P7C73_g2971, partial [Tremellales sp. Uapishka_1]